jgi:hypothetical protein
MNQNRDLDPFTAEQLLSGAPVDGEVGPLADLLAAAAAPARADELMGEAAAVAVFRDAAGAFRPAAAPAAFTGSRRAVGVKVAIAAAAVAATGFAGTAAAGLLPGGNSPAPVAGPTTATQSASSPANGHGAPTTSVPQNAGTGPGTPRQKPTPSGTASKPKSDQSEDEGSVTPTLPRPTAAVIAMCRTYSTMSKHDEGRSRYSAAILDDPYYAPLIRAAGGKTKVAAYCKQVLDEDGDSQGNRAPQVAEPPEQSDHPSGRPTSDPTSRPAASETGNATTALPPPRGR